MNLFINNINSELIAFCKYEEDCFYCMTSRDYFVGQYWDSYLRHENIFSNNETLGILYFDYLKKYKLNYQDVIVSYQEVVKEGNEFKIVGNLPSLFIDFKNNQFYSSFYDQALESTTPEYWYGAYREVLSFIPDNFRYWE